MTRSKGPLGSRFGVPTVLVFALHVGTVAATQADCWPCEAASDDLEVRACLDLNGDGRLDVLRGWPSPRWGNAGGSFSVAIRKEDGTAEHVGSVLIHPKAAHFASTDSGASGVLHVYHRLAAAEGTIRSYRVTKDGLRLVRERPLQLAGPTEQEHYALYNELFDPERRILFEWGRCTLSAETNKVVWEPDEP